MVIAVVVGSKYALDQENTLARQLPSCPLPGCRKTLLALLHLITLFTQKNVAWPDICDVRLTPRAMTMTVWLVMTDDTRLLTVSAETGLSVE